jgi:hypothetical protein
MHFNFSRIVFNNFHKEFLYTTDSQTWYEHAVENIGTLFHTKIQNHEGQKRHLILKVRDVPEKQGHFILSFDDVTELNLMSLFDSESAKNDNLAQDKASILTFR